MKLDNYALLDTGHLRADTTYIHPERLPEVVHLDSPALEVMTDFKSRPPVTTNKKTLIKDAIEDMKSAGVKSLFVIDDTDHIVGHVSALDLHGIKPGQIANDYDIKVTEVTIGMMMTQFDKLPTLNYKYLQSSSVGHIARTLHDLGVNYLIVVEDVDGEEQMVRGLFSILRIRRQLDDTFTGDFSSSTVADMHKRIPD